MSQPQLYRSPAKPGYLGGYNWPAVAVGLLVLVVANSFCTQYIANRFQYQPALGPPLLRLRAGAIYQPFAWAKWGWQHMTDQDPAIRMPFLLGMLVLVAGCFLTVGVFFAMTNRRARLLSMNAEHLHGSACSAEESDIRISGLLTSNDGVSSAAGRPQASVCTTCGTTAKGEPVRPFDRVHLPVTVEFEFDATGLEISVDSAVGFETTDELKLLAMAIQVQLNLRNPLDGYVIPSVGAQDILIEALMDIEEQSDARDRIAGHRIEPRKVGVAPIDDPVIPTARAKGHPARYPQGSS